MLQEDRRNNGFTVGQVAWRLGVKLQEYRELEAGTRSPDFDTWDRICKLYGWPQTFAGSAVGLERWRSSARGQTRSDHRPRSSGAIPTSYEREWSRNG
jgi:hypothetical protein